MFFLLLSTSSFDIGPIYAQRSAESPPRATSLQMLDYLGNLGSEMVNQIQKAF
jgi:hypothetical protein